MSVSEEIILKVAKEIVVKFIEMGRISPSSFPESFQNIYTAIKSTLDRADLLSILSDESGKEKETEE